MAKITKEQYEFALARIEELLPMVDCFSCDWLYLFSSWFGHNQSLDSFITEDF